MFSSEDPTGEGSASKLMRVVGTARPLDVAGLRALGIYWLLAGGRPQLPATWVSQHGR